MKKFFTKKWVKIVLISLWSIIVIGAGVWCSIESVMYQENKCLRVVFRFWYSKGRFLTKDIPVEAIYWCLTDEEIQDMLQWQMEYDVQF